MREQLTTYTSKLLYTCREADIKLILILFVAVAVGL